MVTSISAILPEILQPAAGGADSTPTPRSTVAQAVAQLSTSDILGENQELSLSVDPGTRQIVIRILDSQTKQVLRQFPAEQLLQLAEALSSHGSHASGDATTPLYA